MRALNNPTVPTRLIDVHDHDSQTWSLMETKNHQSYSKYIAVSHRWTEDTPRLLKDNYTSFQTGQHDKVVPRNYEDVFVLCRRLNIRYVWIDSLCIFQDSADDFLEEAATMTEVYANAFCTFSICWECPRGFLRPRETRAIPRNGPLTEDSLKWSDRYVFVQDRRELHLAIGQAPVNRRGWVLQEQLLSPRVLYLGNDQFYWECDEGLLCETEPDCFHPQYNDYKRRSVLVDESRKLQAWHSFVDQFMRLGLSFERDRLLAISGIARFLFSLRDKRLPDGSRPDSSLRIERKFGQTVEYFAGLQRAHWITDLLWYPDLGGRTTWQPKDTYYQRPGPESFKRRPDDIVPSWSWAACPGPIQWTLSSRDGIPIEEFPKHDGGPLACLRKSHFEPLGNDVYGLPKSASLDISCLLIQARYTELSGSEDVHIRSEKSVNKATNNYFEWHTDGFLLPLPYPQLHSDEQSVFITPVEPCDSFIATCFIMPLHKIRGPGEMMITGLIVQERSQADCETREFVRIGSFTKNHTLHEHSRVNEMDRVRALFSIHPVKDPIVEDRTKDRASMGVLNALLKNLPTDGDEFEQELHECTQGWKKEESLGTELEDSVTLKAEWATIRLV
ncbi:tol protein [Fusarium langsethiae]|uniref:Tol protein n=1 Tax=Fusarium langsethiae TaxID=179993 RepID=A0A0M9F1N1_FUSLA|nr:tol protein [Fusarium langsethiae]GKU03647.1 unnamed protein product [Fusarium langsethiae]GKU19450.1 unnamed protein product [Fusarium langsethiae]